MERCLTGDVEVGIAEDCRVVAEELHCAAVLEANAFVMPKNARKTMQMAVLSSYKSVKCTIFIDIYALSQSAVDELELVVAREENSTRVLIENICDAPRSHVTDHLPFPEKIGWFKVRLSEHGVELAGARKLAVWKKTNQILIHVHITNICTSVLRETRLTRFLSDLHRAEVEAGVSALCNFRLYFLQQLLRHRDRLVTLHVDVDVILRARTVHELAATLKVDVEVIVYEEHLGGSCRRSQDTICCTVSAIVWD